MQDACVYLEGTLILCHSLSVSATTNEGHALVCQRLRKEVWVRHTNQGKLHTKVQPSISASVVDFRSGGSCKSNAGSCAKASSMVLNLDTVAAVHDRVFSWSGGRAQWHMHIQFANSLASAA